MKRHLRFLPLILAVFLLCGCFSNTRTFQRGEISLKLPSYFEDKSEESYAEDVDFLYTYRGMGFLGIREKSVYGTQNYDDLLNMIAEKGKEKNVVIEVFQSNHEGAIIDRIQDAYFDKTEAIIINPGAFTHYSYAIRDALASMDMPKIEIHISDITQREEFRKLSVTAPVCTKQIYGEGLDGYLHAIDDVVELLKK